MVHKAAVLVSIAALLLLGAKKPGPDLPEGWQSVSTKSYCALQRGRVALATSDGQTFVLGIEGPRATGSDVRTVQLDDVDITLVFQPANDGVIAVLEATALARLKNASRMDVPWLGVDRMQAVTNVEVALAVLVGCGGKIADKARSRIDLSQKLWAIGEILGSGNTADNDATPPVRHPSISSGGGICLYRGDWVSGFNRNCIYDCTGSQAVQTLSSMQICPTAINR